MPTFKKNPNPTMKKGPYKMKYKHSAFPFKSSPAKRAMGDFMPQVPGDTGAIVPPHTHAAGGGTGASPSGDFSQRLSEAVSTYSRMGPGGRRTSEGEL